MDEFSRAKGRVLKQSDGKGTDEEMHSQALLKVTELIANRLKVKSNKS